jgi:hypothetical protein
MTLMTHRHLNSQSPRETNLQGNLGKKASNASYTSSRLTKGANALTWGGIKKGRTLSGPDNLPSVTSSAPSGLRPVARHRPFKAVSCAIKTIGLYYDLTYGWVRSYLNSYRPARGGAWRPPASPSDSPTLIGLTSGLSLLDPTPGYPPNLAEAVVIGPAPHRCNFKGAFPCLN